MARAQATVLALAAVFVAGSALAGESAPPVDEAFLEFLGTVDVDDEDWIEFLKAIEDEAKAREAVKGKVKSDERPP